jgi:hypothetical protein
MYIATIKVDVQENLSAPDTCIGDNTWAPIANNNIPCCGAPASTKKYYNQNKRTLLSSSSGAR